MGRLKTNLTQGSNTANVIINQGALKGGSHVDAERANTLCWVDGECLSYETAQLQLNGDYALGGIIRGQYGTNDTAHNAGARFVRVDEALYHAPYRKEDIGKQVYFKFTSFNMYGSNEQGLDEVQAYPYTITPYYIPEVSDLALFTKYYEIGDGVLSFDVVAVFTQPTINTFDTVEAWYREGTNEWKYGGNGDNQIVISGCELGHTYEVRLKVKDRHGNYSQGIIKSVLVELKSEVPNTPQGLGVSFGDVATFNWLEVCNADIDFYELRYDLHPGQEYGLIGKSNNTTLSTLLTERSAKVYLYAHNPTKGYSAPAELTYNVPIPKKPTKVTATANIGGIGVVFESIPPNCKGANVYVDDNTYYTTSNAMNIPLTPGVYRVKVAYVDIFGEGPRTDDQLVTVKATIPADMITEESLANANLAGKVKEAVDNGTAEIKQEYTKLVTDLDADPAHSKFSAITQLNDGLGLAVKKDNIISAINLSPETITLDGKFVHITGDTKFDNDVIAPGMIQAGAVTADKMQVDSLSSITATIGTLRTKTSGARVEISDDLIQVFDENNQLRVRIGIWE